MTRITLATRPYDGVLPITRGEVRIPGVEVDAREMMNIPRMFEGFFRGEYDVSEMSLAEAVYYTSRDEAQFTCVPVFPSRLFRFGYLFCSVASGITGPEGTNGRRIGFQRWVQTAGVWMRGQLVEEYGVSPAATEWYVRSLFHWEDATHDKVTPRDGSTIRYLPGRENVQTETGYLSLMEGEVDVMGITENQLGPMLNDRRVRRLIPDYSQADADYYRKTGIFPIMHVLCMRSSLAQERPELPAQLFDAYVEAKAIVRRQAAVLPSHALARRPAYIDEEAAGFGSDPWRHGLEANRHVLQKFISYCYDQGIAARKFLPDELFHPGTRTLKEKIGEEMP
jgi:4,5-dihydroxyphthalate decarboxylase